MNYGYDRGEAQSAGNQLSAVPGAMLVTSRKTTVAQNIENRIVGLREQIARLEEVKQKLSRGTILDVSLEDLQMALGRY